MRVILSLILLILLGACNREPTTFPVVKYVNALRSGPEKPDSVGPVYLDTIKPHRRLYGLGKIAGQHGEIMIVDGRPYVSFHNESGERFIRQTYNVNASSLIYTHARSWGEVDLPADSILDNENLGRHLEMLAEKSGIDVNKPFPFLLKGHFRQITYHRPGCNSMCVVEKGGGSKNMEEADVIILGFFSRNQETIFTPPGAKVVMGFMTTSASVIGQIDQLRLKGKKVQLLLPE